MGKFVHLNLLGCGELRILLSHGSSVPALYRTMCCRRKDVNVGYAQITHTDLLDRQNKIPFYSMERPQRYVPERRVLDKIRRFTWRVGNSAKPINPYVPGQCEATVNDTKLKRLLLGFGADVAVQYAILSIQSRFSNESTPEVHSLLNRRR